MSVRRAEQCAAKPWDSLPALGALDGFPDFGKWLERFDSDELPNITTQTRLEGWTLVSCGELLGVDAKRGYPQFANIYKNEKTERLVAVEWWETDSRYGDEMFVDIYEVKPVKCITYEKVCEALKLPDLSDECVNL